MILLIVTTASSLTNRFNFIVSILNCEGGGGSREVYLYKRLINGDTPLTPMQNAKMVKIPGRSMFAEADKDVYCDPAFAKTISDVVAGVHAMRLSLTATINSANVIDHTLRGSSQVVSPLATPYSSAQRAEKPVILLLNATRASALGQIRADNIEARSNHTVQVITVKLCSSQPEIQNGKLRHINGELRCQNGMNHILSKLSENHLPPPWVIIMDYIEPFGYGSR